MTHETVNATLVTQSSRRSTEMRYVAKVKDGTMLEMQVMRFQTVVNLRSTTRALSVSRSHNSTHLLSSLVSVYHSVVNCPTARDCCGSYVHIPNKSDV